MRIDRKKKEVDLGKLTAAEKDFLRDEFINLCESALNANFDKKAGEAFDSLKLDQLDSGSTITATFPVTITAGVLKHLIRVYRITREAMNS